MQRPKRLIAIDGLDGSGKETQTKLLEQALREKGIPCRTVSFPTYDGEMSAAVNLYLQGRFGEDPGAVNGYAASTFYAVDRFCSYRLDWQKDYEAGTVILANRYTTANAVHQLSKLPPEEYDAFLDWLFEFEYGKLGLPAPDLVLYLCVPPAVSAALIRRRASETGRVTDIHEKSPSHLQDSYRAALYASEKLGWTTVHCAGEGDSLRTREDIHSQVLGYVEQLLRNEGKAW
ncbi:MAG: thymidylate kinase [Oscillospiraceae bacterium]|nr:thymidylate kinase [Oscillospiraceae bacterium]